MLKKSLLALAVVGSALPAVSFAEDAASPLSFNVGAVSEYRYRGISQTRFKPTIQGGADYALPGGFYIGTWASGIKWIKDAGQNNSVDAGNAQIEVDVYGGYKREVAKDVTLDVGLLQYLYPNNHYGNVPSGANANTLELYGALTFGPATVKYSHSLTNLFGNADSKGSGYLEAAATFDVGAGISLTPHVGYQKVHNYKVYSYTDYSLAAAKDAFGFTFSLTAIGTDTKEVPTSFPYVAPTGKNLGRSAVVFGVKKTF